MHLLIWHISETDGPTKYACLGASRPFLLYFNHTMAKSAAFQPNYG